jgi:hypothetical protein
MTGLSTALLQAKKVTVRWAASLPPIPVPLSSPLSVFGPVLLRKIPSPNEHWC